MRFTKVGNSHWKKFDKIGDRDCHEKKVGEEQKGILRDQDPEGTRFPVIYPVDVSTESNTLHVVSATIVKLYKNIASALY